MSLEMYYRVASKLETSVKRMHRVKTWQKYLAAFLYAGKFTGNVSSKI